MQRLWQGTINNHKSFGYVSRQIEDSVRKLGAVPSLALGGSSRCSPVGAGAITVVPSPLRGNLGWFPALPHIPATSKPPGPLASDFLCKTGHGSPPLPSEDTILTDVMSQKRKDREEKNKKRQCTVQCPPIFLLVPITVKSIYRALITKGSWRGRGRYKPIKNILTFEYHNGVRGWMLPRLPPTKKGFFAFLYPPTLITGNFRKMRLDTCAREIKRPTHISLKRLRQPQTLI